MTVSALSSRRFTLEDQLEFAEISGDWNPMHVDAIAARRTIYGEVVVHGIHALLWALECLAHASSGKRGLLYLKTKFKRQMHLNELISCKLLPPGKKDFKLSLEAKGKVVVQIEGSFSQLCSEAAGLPKKIARSDCRDLKFGEISAASGSLPLFIDQDRLGKMFPGVLSLLSAGQIAELLATTRLVGMECPGRHSIYLGHDLHFHERTKGANELCYEVTRSDGRFSMLWLNVTGPTMRGTITAFARPRPQKQAAIEVVRGVVIQDEFIKSRALVIGGSRGLGEITAKIIATGGGDVCITYHQGKEDAERVAEEIRSAGFKCNYVPFNVTTSSESLAAQLGTAWKPNELYYFATPPISLEAEGWFSREKFDTYCRFYVNGFSSTLDTVLRLGAKNLVVFYPSSIFLEQFQEHSTEYCAAKAAGELLCRHLEQLFPPVRVYAPRLKRMTTDQTSGLMPIDAEDSLLGMLSSIRGMPTPS